MKVYVGRVYIGLPMKNLYLEQALTGRNQWWIYCLGLFFVFLSIMLGNMPILVALLLDGGTTLNTTMDLYNLGWSNNKLLLLMLMPFVFGLVGALIMIRMIHMRSIRSLITSRSTIDYSRILTGFIIVLMISALFTFIEYWTDPDTLFIRPFTISTIVLFLISILIIPLQAAFEEVMFRGYLYQAFGLAARSRIVAWIVTSALFGLMHFQNPEVSENGFMAMMPYYIGMGLLLGLITIVDGGLELAVGVHAGTNFYSAFIVSYEGSVMPTDALIHSTADIGSNSVYLSLLFFVIMTIILSSLYRWPNWLKKLTYPIQDITGHNMNHIDSQINKEHKL